MWNWLARYSERQKDLARGVDSTLVRANRRRYKIALGLIVSSLVLAEAVRAADLSGGLA